MDFLPTQPRDVPRMLYQCTAAITIGTAEPRRRSSFGSNHSDEGGGLARIISGGRRKSASGQGGVIGGNKVEGNVGEGTWFWRCRVGVTDSSLEILPISSPPNPLLKTRPPPLSHILQPQPKNTNAAQQANASLGVGGKFMGALRRASAGFMSKPEHGVPPAPADGGIPENAVEDTPASPTEATGDTVSHAHATNDVNADEHETQWPAVVDGQPLQAIVVPLHNLSKESIRLGGSDKKSFHVSASIGSAISGKAGHLRFEFDKDWVGAKGESELLYDRLTAAVTDAAPLFNTVQLGGTPANNAAPGAPPVAGGAPVSTSPGVHPFEHVTRKHIIHDAEYDPKWQDKLRGPW